jgi:hypothetical protein
LPVPPGPVTDAVAHEQRRDLGNLVGATDERRGRHRQVRPRRARRRTRPLCRGRETWIMDEHASMELLQLFGWLESELVHERLAQLLVGG